MRITLWVLSVSLILAVARTSAQEFVSLFNGKSLDGWVQRGGKAKYVVEDGTIVGTTVKGTPNSFLCTERDYGDFVLELEVKADPNLNSGIQIRSHCYEYETTYETGAKTAKIPAGRVHGYQVEVDHQPSRRWSGGIYEEGRRGWLFDLTKNKAAGEAFKFGDWNKYRIECRGASIKTWVNGVPAADLLDAETPSGFIALQVHSSSTEGLQVAWRNIKIQELGRHAWKAAWRGNDLSGGHIIGKGDWKVENGIIHATHQAADKEYGHLVSNETMSDFVVRIKYKAVKGNSGLYFRTVETGASGVSGFQAEIDAEKDAAGLYETNGRGWVYQPTTEQVQRWFKPQDWNTMTVYALGRRIATDLNGGRIAELRDDPGRLEGHSALQLHGGQDVEVYFKDIELLLPVEN